MITRILPRFALVIFATLTLAHAGNPDGAKAALNALPNKYEKGVLRVEGDAGKPNPPSWIIIARNSQQGGANYNVEIADGQIVRERLSLNLRVMVGSPINLSKIRIGSGEAWKIAADYAVSKGKQLGAVDYLLQQQSSDAVPIWELTCDDVRGRSIGTIKVLATTGKIISKD